MSRPTCSSRNGQCTTCCGTRWWLSCTSHILSRASRAPFTDQHDSLRQIEYYRGILFLTTNRITTFDDAFLSRIHIALHFTELTAPAKMDIWRTFIRKADADQDAFTDDIVAQLSTRAVNGRQIKNVCHTASSLARSRGEKLKYEHLVNALDALEEFQAQFDAMRSAC